MRVYVLVENTSCHGFDTEHGLSLYIDTGTRKILFDMGGSDLFYKNAVKLGIDLSLVDMAIISHGHSDHGGGLSTFLKINKSAPVYISKRAFLPYYNAKGNYIGLDMELERNPRLIFVDDTIKIDDKITIYPASKIELKNEINSFGLTKKVDNVSENDDFAHEQYLEIIQGNSKILFSGCSHRGILNIVSSLLPNLVIGGFHSSKIQDENELFALASNLDNTGAKFITCHCTGVNQFNLMAKNSKNIFYASTGDVFEI